MAKITPRRWARDEVIMALGLYCQIPFGQMHKSNPHVKLLAGRLGRTASSIAMKLVNLASLDPEHKSRGVSGMSHVSQLDRVVWDEFYGKWDTLVKILDFDIAEPIYASARDNEVLLQSINDNTEVQEIHKARRGQQFFRNAVVAAYGSSCCITGISKLELLRASHILPWSASSISRLDPCNGLCLNSLHDAAFDRGLITVTEEMCLQISPCLASTMSGDIYQEFFEQFDGISIRIPERFFPSQEYLSYHRDHIYQK